MRGEGREGKVRWEGVKGRKERGRTSITCPTRWLEAQANPTQRNPRGDNMFGYAYDTMKHIIISGREKIRYHGLSKFLGVFFLQLFVVNVTFFSGFHLYRVLLRIQLLFCTTVELCVCDCSSFFIVHTFFILDFTTFFPSPPYTLFPSPLFSQAWHFFLLHYSVKSTNKQKQ